MPWRLASTPVAKVDQATGEIDGFEVSSGRNTPCSASFCEVRQPALAHQLGREARVHAVEAEHDDAPGACACLNGLPTRIAR